MHTRPREARTLGIKASALYYKLDKYGIDEGAPGDDRARPPPEAEGASRGALGGGPAARGCRQGVWEG